MNIHIIVHSMTGKTRSFADLIFARLQTAGHIVNLTELKTKETIKGGTVRQKMDITFTNLPDVSSADVVLFGAPVWAFGPSPVIYQAIVMLGSQLKGKKILPFFTMGFPFAWMGGSGAVNFMRRYAGTLGARVLNGYVVTGMRKGFEARMEAKAEEISKAL